jgi:dipeptidyl aminopeptidase/acylaminoacyl peptidase
MAFSGNTNAVIFNAILNHSPNSPIELNPDVSPKVEEIICKALEKDRELRYQHASDMRADLKRLRRDTSSGRYLAPGLGGTSPAAAPSRSSGINAAEPATPLPGHDVKEGLASRRWRAYLASGAAILTIVAVAWYVFWRVPNVAFEEIQLTYNPSDDPVVAPILSPDGKWLVYSDHKGIHVRHAETGETRIIASRGELSSDVLWRLAGWFPNGTKLLATAFQAVRPGIWTISVISGERHKLRDDGVGLSVSPDGSLILYMTGPRWDVGKEVWVMSTNGEDSRKLLIAQDATAFFWAQWSPDGHHMACMKWLQSKQVNSLEIYDLEGAKTADIISLPGLDQFCWLANGTMLYTKEDVERDATALLEVPIALETGRPRGKPREVARWTGFDVVALSGSMDSKRLTYARVYRHNGIYLADIENGGLRLSAPRPLVLVGGNVWAYPSDWTPDSKAVFYHETAKGKGIQKQDLALSSEETVVPGDTREGIVTPDHTWLLYKSAKGVMGLPISGGASDLICPSTAVRLVRCPRAVGSPCVLAERSADKKQLVFHALDPLRGKGQQLASVDIGLAAPFYEDFSWDVSPDGSRLVLTEPDKADSRVRVITLSDGREHDVVVKGWKELYLPSWSKDGKG